MIRTYSGNKTWDLHITYCLLQSCQVWTISDARFLRKFGDHSIIKNRNFKIFGWSNMTDTITYLWEHFNTILICNIKLIQYTTLEKMAKNYENHSKTPNRDFWAYLLTQQLMQGQRGSSREYSCAVYSLSGPHCAPKSDFLRILTKSICEITYFQNFADSATFARSERIL